LKPILEPGTSRGGAVVGPLLLECDLRGQVTWMSDRTRLAFGSAGTLAGAMVQASRRWKTPRGRPGVTFSALLEKGNRVVVTAELAEPLDALRPGCVDLPVLQSSLLRHYFRLQIAERNLTARAQAWKSSRRVSAGRAAVRQIELERQRVGRELHTGVGQMLAAIRLQLEVISSCLPEPPQGVGQALSRISTLASDALEHVRSVSKRLHPPEWQRLSLQEAIRQLWDLSGIPQRYEATLDLQPLASEP